MADTKQQFQDTQKNIKKNKCSPPKTTLTPQAHHIQTAGYQRQRENDEGSGKRHIPLRGIRMNNKNYTRLTMRNYARQKVME